jgi:L-ribulose-5-phosphate 3-epimerase
VLLAYNTNGLALHDPAKAIRLLAEIGYRGVGLTIDRDLLNPYVDGFEKSIARVCKLLERYKMRSVIETGARFLLDPQNKHEPTLMTADRAGRARRIEFYRHAIDMAHELGSDCVSLWSGKLNVSIANKAAFSRLIEGLQQVCDYADLKQVTLGFEPEPGMFIDTMDGFAQLAARFASSPLRLTLDIGHLHCQGEVPIAEQIGHWKSQIVNVHLEDMRHGIHEHLMFGEGEIDFPPVIGALRAIDYHGLLQVELSRHSQMGPEAARQAFDFLQPLMAATSLSENRLRKGGQSPFVPKTPQKGTVPGGSRIGSKRRPSAREKP